MAPKLANFGLVFAPIYASMRFLGRAFFLSLTVVFLMAFVPAGPAHAQHEDVLDASPTIALLQGEGFSQWLWLKSTCDDCEIRFVAKSPTIQSPKVAEFIRALEERKPELMALYAGGQPGRQDLSDSEYNLLAHMAIGILGRESEFFSSTRYLVKENIPWLVNIFKLVRHYVTGKAVDGNSRGPTQIKFLPKNAVEVYGIKPGDLKNPTKAAIATMSFLIEALAELKNHARYRKLTFITPATYPDYLPYIYFGARRQLINRTATPERNIYVRDMRKYMGWVEIYERPRRIPLR
jgi:hypothetical protein